MALAEALQPDCSITASPFPLEGECKTTGPCPSLAQVEIDMDRSEEHMCGLLRVPFTSTKNARRRDSIDETQPGLKRGRSTFFSDHVTFDYISAIAGRVEVIFVKQCQHDSIQIGTTEPITTNRRTWAPSCFINKDWTMSCDELAPRRC